MRWRFIAGILCFGATPTFAVADGPQIQITNTSLKIVTRQLYRDAPYAAATGPRSVYAIPVLPFNGVSYSRPNGTVSPITLAPVYPSGPGLAYGSDLADGGPQDFSAGGVLSIDFLEGLKRWDGAAFVDAGVTQLKAFRGSNENVASPAQNFAITSDAGPFDSVSLPQVATGYGPEGAEVHSSLRYALLGDGTSPASSSPDGVYLLKLQVSSTQIGLSPSDPFYFVLYKNSPAADVSAAVQSLNVSPELVQFVPEPALLFLLGPVVFMVAGRAGCRRTWNR